MVRKLFRSALALVAGIISLGVAIGALSQIAFRIWPALGAVHTTIPEYSPIEFAALAFVNVVAGIVGGWVASAIAGRAGAWHAAIIAGFILVVGVIADAQHVGSSLAHAESLGLGVVAAVCCLLGGWGRRRRNVRSADRPQ